MLLSIVVPTYNVESYLSNCLDSLLNQDLDKGDYEIIVVNDGATDSSPQIAASFEKNFDQVKVFHQENQGLSAARNQGMKLASGKYIYFIDSDDYIAHNTLGYALREMERLDLDILGLGVLNTPKLDIHHSNNYEIIEVEDLEVRDGITYIADKFFLNNVWWYITRRDFLIDTGLQFPVGRFVEDAIFTSALISKSRRIAHSSLDFYRYLIRPNSIMTKRSKAHALKMINDYEKNVYDFEPHIELLRGVDHPKIKPCLDRLEARQHSFVFFMLVKCIKSQLTKDELGPILERLAEFGAYPINKAFRNDYNNITYKAMLGVMNRKQLLYGALASLKAIHKLFPNIYLAVDGVTKLSFKTRNPRSFVKSLYGFFFKRLLDIITATLAFVILFPVFLLVMLVLLITNNGKPFFLQERPGRHEKLFKIIKFKSMNDRKDEHGELLPFDQRITKFGAFIRKYSLDEIPQLINVIKGDMSLIGPRPLLKQYLPLYNDFQRRRHEVRPGISGWAQVNGRNAISWDEKFKYDIYYVDHLSFTFDLKIMLLTIKKVLFREGVNSSVNLNMPDFTGNEIRQPEKFG